MYASVEDDGDDEDCWTNAAVDSKRAKSVDPLRFVIFTVCAMKERDSIHQFLVNENVDYQTVEKK